VVRGLEHRFRPQAVGRRTKPVLLLLTHREFVAIMVGVIL
jgi:hypothetical protein